MNHKNQYAWAVICLGLAICFLIFTLLLFVKEVRAGEWNTGWDDGDYMAVTVNQSKDSFGLSGKPGNGRYLLVVSPYNNVPYPKQARMQLVVSVDGIAIGEEQVIILSRNDNKSYATFVTDTVVAHLMAGQQVTFLILDSKIDSNPIKFRFNLDGSQEALAPLVEQNP